MEAYNEKLEKFYTVEETIELEKRRIEVWERARKKLLLEKIIEKGI